jgi:hypothetical protein
MVIYDIDESMKEKFPAKSTTNELIDEINCCQKLVDIIEQEDNIVQYAKVKETVIEHLQISQYTDAKTGHKSAYTSFFGYKTHIAMTEERIITAATITTGEKTMEKSYKH